MLGRRTMGREIGRGAVDNGGRDLLVLDIWLFGKGVALRLSAS